MPGETPRLLPEHHSPKLSLSLPLCTCKLRSELSLALLLPLSDINARITHRSANVIFNRSTSNRSHNTSISSIVFKVCNCKLSSFIDALIVSMPSCFIDKLENLLLTAEETIFCRAIPTLTQRFTFLIRNHPVQNRDKSTDARSISNHYSLAFPPLNSYT